MKKTYKFLSLLALTVFSYGSAQVQAVDDNFFVFGSLTTHSIFGNDTVNNLPADSTNTTFTIDNGGLSITNNPDGSKTVEVANLNGTIFITVHPNGTVTLPGGIAPDSIFFFKYTLCDAANPSECADEVYATFTFNRSFGNCSDLPLTGTPLAAQHGITALKRAGDNNDGNPTNDWPTARGGAFTVLEAKTKPFVVNRMPNPETAVKNPIEGMMIYDTDDHCLKIYVNGAWRCYNNKNACPSFVGS